MDVSRPNKRRRLVASCTECHRRKQKCDRQKPCSTCIARNVPDKCSYDDQTRFQEVVFSNSGYQTEPENALYQDPIYPTELAQPSQFDPYLSTFEDSTYQETTLEAPQPQEVSPPDDTNPDDLIDPLLREANPASQFGYSGSGNNDAIGFKQLLQDEPTFREVTTPGLTPNPHSKDMERRFWELTARLPPMRTTKKLVDLFFIHVNWHYSILAHYHFDDLLRRWTDCSKSSTSPSTLQGMQLEVQRFPALLFQVLALALQYLPSDIQFPDLLEPGDHSKYDRVALEYSDSGVQIVEQLGRHRPCLVTVKQDFLRASTLKNFGRIAESWHVINNAIRQAQELGLHRHTSVHRDGIHVDQTLDMLWYDEIKRRVWMNLFIWDSHMSMISGRPHKIHADDCDTKAPTDCEIPNDPSKTISMPVRPDEKPTPFSERLFQYSLAQIFHRTAALGTDRRHIKDYSIIQKLHDEALALLDKAPPTLRPENTDISWDTQFPLLRTQREQVLSALNMYLVALHRPYILDHEESRTAVWEAALTILESQQRIFKESSPHLHKSYTQSFLTADAAIVASALAIKYAIEDENSQRRIKHDLSEAITRLKSLKKATPVAASGLVIVLRCCRKVWEIYGIKNSSEDIGGTTSRTGSYLEEKQASFGDNTPQEHLQQLDSNLPSWLKDLPSWDVIDTTALEPSHWLEQLGSAGLDILNPSITSST